MSIDKARMGPKHMVIRIPPKIEVNVRERPVLTSAEEALGNARSIFLETLALNAPEVLKELHREVLPIFQTIPGSVKSQTDHGPKTVKFGESELTIVELPDVFLWRNLEKYGDVKEVQETKNALWSWAKHYDSHADWLLDTALQTLDIWCGPESSALASLLAVVREEDEDDIFDGRLNFFQVPKVRTLTAAKAVQYTHAGWKEGESSKDYEERQLDAFKEHLLGHRKARRTDGYCLPPEVENYEHFTWLALAYGRRLNFRQIADLPEEERSNHIFADAGKFEQVKRAKEQYRTGEKVLDEDIVRKAVHGKAKLIGLPPLRVTRGRPPKPRGARKSLRGLDKLKHEVFGPRL